MAGFLWGQKGLRLTPDQVAAERQSAAQRMQQATSTAPIGHWSQGAANMVNALMAGLDIGSTRKAERRNREEGDALMQALLGGGEGELAQGAVEGGTPATPFAPDQSTVMRAMNNPYVPESVRNQAKMLYEQHYSYKAPMNANGVIFDQRTGRVIADHRTPPSVIQLQRIADDPNAPESEKSAARMAIAAQVDPIINMPLPGGGLGLGPKSWYQDLASGGTPFPPQQPQPPVQKPPSLPRNFFDNGGPGAAAPGRFPG